MDVQRNLESNVEKRTKDSFGPPSGKRLVVFIDDMNMPRVCATRFWLLVNVPVHSIFHSLAYCALLAD